MNIFKKLLKNFFEHKKTKMEQEIYEQSDVIFELIRKYINKDYSINIEFSSNVNKVAFVASGSSYNSACIAADFIKSVIHCDVKTYYSSEVVICDDFYIDNETLYIFISQSGETSDTNNAFDKISQATDKTFAITNVKNSKLWNNSKYKMLTLAGNEKAVASTKSMTAQLFCLFLAALKLMEIKDIPTKKYIDELINVPEYIKNVYSKREQIKSYANLITNYEHAVILASGMFYSAAKEGALKVKETTYINTAAYPTGEFLHGHIAILNKKCVVMVIVNEMNLHSTIDVLMRINNNYKVNTLIISTLPIKDADKNDFIQIDTKSDINFLFSAIVIFQLLAFESALILDRNVDKPEGLSKVVK